MSDTSAQATSKLNKIPSLENIPFGSIFSTHMLQATYKDGNWSNYEIVPYGSMELYPSISALHYGQAIFEGMKAFSDKATDKIGIFRINDHYERMNYSAHRLQMPAIPEKHFIDGLKTLISIDRNWVPNFDGHSLYIRPFMFADDLFLGVRPSLSYRFMVITSPASVYYSSPIKVLVESSYSRAASGGVGNVKVAGNYAASLFPTQLAMKEGYDQVLWTDSETHGEVQEVGTMNIFFVVDNKVITPTTERNTILKGITRKSVIQLLTEQNIKVDERNISIHEIMEAHSKGTLVEVFGTGTAVVINSVSELKYKDHIIKLNPGNEHSLSHKLRQTLNDIRYGKTEDPHGWMTWV